MSKRTLNEEEIQPNIKIPLQPFLKDDQPEGEVAIKTGSCWRWNHCDSFVKLVFKKNLGLELVCKIIFNICHLISIIIISN